MLVRRNMMGVLNMISRGFAKRKVKKVKIVERDEYDLKTAIDLIKAGSLASKDESIDVLVKYIDVMKIRYRSKER